MSFIQDLIDKAKNLLWDDVAPTPEAPPPPSKTATIKRDGFDEVVYDVMQQQARPLRTAVAEIAEEFDEAAGDTYEDLFNLLNQGAPLLEDAGAIAATHRVNHEVMRQLAESEQVADLRRDTAHDRYQTLFSMLSMKDQVRESYQALYEASQQEQQAQQDLQQAAERMMAPGPQPDPNALQQAVEAAQQAAQASQQAATDVAQQIEQGAAQAKRDIDATKDALGGYSLGEDEARTMDYAERRRLVERLDKTRMAKLAEMIGSFRQFGTAERRKRVKHAPSARYDYVLGNDLTRLVPEELNNLAVPELEDMFWLRWAQHGLLTREVRGEAKAGKGPIIVVSDESTSMDGKLGANGETREMWSKAVSLALCDTAAKDKRDFTYIGFSDKPLYEIAFPKGNAPLTQVVAFAEHFLGGGTEPVKPLMRALAIVEEYEKRDLDKPDIVFISDGDFKLSTSLCERWIELVDRVDAKCYGIQIGGASSGSLPDITHHQLQITSLNATPEGVQQLFAGI